MVKMKVLTIAIILLFVVSAYFLGHTSGFHRAEDVLAERNNQVYDFMEGLK